MLLYAVATWYFSDQIRASALDVTTSEPTYDVTVTDVDGEHITLDDSAHPHPVLRDERWTYGIRWEGGEGSVGGPAEVDGDEVTRMLQVTDGSAPQAGDEVALNRDLVSAFPEDDDELEQIEFPAGDGTLPAWFADRDADADTWAILVHGKGGSPAEMVRMAYGLHDAELPTMMIGYRNDPGTTAGSSGRYGYGATEWRDLASAVAYAQRHGANHVVLGGASMGGAVVASYLEHANAPSGFVRGIVLDAPMLDLDAVVDHGAERKGLPGFLTSSAEWLAGMRFGVDWDAVDYVDDTSWVVAPTLVLHGDADDTVPFAVSKALAAAEPDLVTLEEFEAGHVESFNSDRDRYSRAVDEFARSVTG